ncbi:MAG: hypothetical protein RBS68_13355 [Anaerolineales bacterium]|jgi:hypothetical protein|nr:hypothetical protein [Anaerolineales bacterium]
MTILDRILLLLTGLLAAWQVAIGIDAFDTLPVIAYTLGFGVLLVAGLLLIILGFEILDSPAVVIVSTLIPLSLALGLAWQYLEAYRGLYLIFTIAGFLAISLTRLIPTPGKLPVFTLAAVHAIAGLTIFLLPILLAVRGSVRPGFALVGLGGALIGVGGLLLSFLKAGRPVLSRERIFKILPGLLFLMTTAFVAGFLFG